MLFYIFAGVIFIALVVFLVYSAKLWHWAHITAVALVFLTAVPAYYCAAYVLKTRKAIVKEHLEAQKAAESERTRYLNVLYGAQTGTGGGFGDGSLKAELTRYKLLTTGKGRSWDQSTLQSRNETAFVFEVSAPAPAPVDENAAAADPAAADPAAAPVADAAAGTEGEYPLVGALVYAFQLTGLQVGENRLDVPGGYMGSFRVTAVEGNRVTTVPEFLMATEVRLGDGIALFERPPLDTHDVMQAALGFSAADKPTIDDYREKFQTVFPPETFGLTPASQSYLDLLDAFSFDGRSIESEINVWLSAQGRPAWNPGVEEIVAVSRVLREFEETVDGSQDVVTSGDFDALGRANDPELQLGKPARIAASRAGDDADVILIDKATASSGYPRPDGTQVRSWEEDGRSETVTNLYSRRLRDHTTEIQQLRFDRGVVDQRIAEYTRFNASVQASLTASQAQEDLRATQITDLTQDQENLKGDLRIVGDYLADLEFRLGELRREIRDTYLQISHLHQQSLQEAASWAAAQR
jgi:hypothetical protein